MWLLSNRIKVRDSGLLEGCCDYHCHLLPGVDDGVQETAETLDILNLWEGVGVKDVWMTPHVMEDIPNDPDDLTIRFGELKSRYHGSITLHLAAENMLDGLFSTRLDSRQVLAIGKEQNKLLVETSYYNPPINLEQMMSDIKSQGFTPVLAHPERYQYMEMDDYVYWKGMGVLFQLNIPALAGMYGAEVRYKAESLLKRDLYDCVGTDTHSADFAEDFLERELKKQVVRGVRNVILKPDI